MRGETIGLIVIGIFTGFLIGASLTNLLLGRAYGVSFLVMLGTIMFLLGFSVGWRRETIRFIGIGFFIGFLIYTVLKPIPVILVIGVATFLVGFSVSGILSEKAESPSRELDESSKDADISRPILLSS